jgi:hypothetical protein
VPCWLASRNVADLPADFLSLTTEEAIARIRGVDGVMDAETATNSSPHASSARARRCRVMDTIYPESPGHRGVDTSFAAAADLEVKLGRLQRMVLAAIREAGWLGLTADELCDRLKLSRWTVQPRTSEMKRKGLIRDSGQRRRNASGKHAIVRMAA